MKNLSAIRPVVRKPLQKNSWGVVSTPRVRARINYLRYTTTFSLFSFVYFYIFDFFCIFLHNLDNLSNLHKLIRKLKYDLFANSWTNWYRPDLSNL